MSSSDHRPSDDKPSEASAQLIAHYDELRRYAQSLIKKEAMGCSVEATHLVHVAFESLFLGDKEPNFENEKHVLRATSRAMRHLLVDRARRRHAVKRGGNRLREDVDLRTIPVQEMDADALLDLNNALDALEDADQESARLVELHCFARLSIAQVALELGCSKSRADTIWLFARRWLARAMNTQA